MFMSGNWTDMFSSGTVARVIDMVERIDLNDGDRVIHLIKECRILPLLRTVGCHPPPTYASTRHCPRNTTAVYHGQLRDHVTPI